jgi:hypothetical protein
MISAVSQDENVTGIPVRRKILFFLEEDFSGMEERKKSQSGRLFRQRKLRG